jgi:hypothetical protein
VATNDVAAVRVLDEHLKMEPLRFGDTGLHVGHNKELFEALQSPFLPAQEAMILLRLCGIPRFSYLLRTVRPAVMRNAALLFDMDVASASRAILKIGPPSAQTPQDWDNAKTQMTLPLRMGGLGLPLMAAMTDIAYISSLAASVETTTSHQITMHSVSHLAGDFTPALRDVVHRSLHAIRAQVRGEGALSLLPTDDADFQSFYRPRPQASSISEPKTKGMQHTLWEAASKAMAEGLHDSGPPEGAPHDQFTSRLNAVSAPGSHTWITTIPSTPHLSLSDFQYRAATRMRLGLKPMDIMPRTCSDCGHQMDTDIDHFLTCIKRRRTDINTRHDQVALFIAQAVRLAGGSAILEPGHLNHDDRKRADLDVRMDQSRALVDVAIVHPTAPSHCHTGAVSQLGVAKRAVRIKTAKYSLISHANQCPFVPFVMETYGGMTQESAEFCTSISLFAEQYLNPLCWKSLVRDLFAGVSIAIQRGNGIAARSCLVVAA